MQRVEPRKGLTNRLMSALMLTPQGEGNRPLYEGFSHASTRAIQLVVTPLVMAFIGFVLDGRLGTRPFLAMGLGILGLVGESIRMYQAYVAEMKKREEGKPWAKP